MQVIEYSYEFKGLIMTPNHDASPSTSRHCASLISRSPASDGMLLHCRGLEGQSFSRSGRRGGAVGSRGGQRASRGSTAIHTGRIGRRGRRGTTPPIGLMYAQEFQPHVTTARVDGGASSLGLGIDASHYLLDL